MNQGVRVIGPDRAQLRWEMVDLDSQLPDDHRARLVWAFVEGLDLSEFYDRIKARDAGRPAMDPQVVLAVWLYATLEGIGSAGRLIACANSTPPIAGCAAARRSITICWRRFGARMRVVGSPADPERDRADRRKADQLGGVGDRRDQEPALAKAGVRAWAGRGSMSKCKRLENIAKAVAERVAELKSELDKDPG